MTKIGYVGDHRKVSDNQKLSLIFILSNPDIELHISNSRGSEDVVNNLPIENLNKVVYEPDLEETEDLDLDLEGKGKVKFPKKDLRRFRTIIENCDILVIAPDSTRENLSYIPWLSSRYATKLNKPVIVLQP